MRRKKHTPTHSQILGIIWLSAALLIIAAVAFFSSRHTSEAPQTDITEALHQEILTQKEDSVYRRKSGKRKVESGKRKVESGKRSYAVRDGSTSNVPLSPYKKQPLTVELNSADTLTLQLLHGIGPAYARRVVRYRERLGGFVSYDQLLEVYGFTPELLTSLRPCLSLDTTAVRHININTIELKQLARHPYVEYYQARDIVRLRSAGTRFATADDLRAVPSMADSTLERLKPYLEF